MHQTNHDIAELVSRLKMLETRNASLTMEVGELASNLDYTTRQLNVMAEFLVKNTIFTYGAF